MPDRTPPLAFLFENCVEFRPLRRSGVKRAVLVWHRIDVRSMIAALHFSDSSLIASLAHFLRNLDHSLVELARSVVVWLLEIGEPGGWSEAWRPAARAAVESPVLRAGDN